MADRRVYWLDGQSEGDTLVSWRDGRVSDVLPPGTHVASAVHEYGDGAYAVHGGEVWFVRGEDQQIWRTLGGILASVTSTPSVGEHRYGDLRISLTGVLVCVRERHLGLSCRCDRSAGPARLIG